MTNEEIGEILEKAYGDAAKLLAKRIKGGKATAADINAMNAMRKELGITLTFNSRPTPLGNKVMESLKDIDPNLLN